MLIANSWKAHHQKWLLPLSLPPLLRNAKTVQLCTISRSRFVCHLVGLSVPLNAWIRCYRWKTIHALASYNNARAQHRVKNRWCNDIYFVILFFLFGVSFASFSALRGRGYYWRTPLVYDPWRTGINGNSLLHWIHWIGLAMSSKNFKPTSVKIRSDPKKRKENRKTNDQRTQYLEITCEASLSIHLIWYNL